MDGDGVAALGEGVGDVPADAVFAAAGHQGRFRLRVGHSPMSLWSAFDDSQGSFSKDAIVSLRLAGLNWFCRKASRVACRQTSSAISALGEAFAQRTQLIDVHSRGVGFALEVDTVNEAAGWRVRFGDLDLVIESARAKQGGIDNRKLVGGADDEDAIVWRPCRPFPGEELGDDGIVGAAGRRCRVRAAMASSSSRRMWMQGRPRGPWRRGGAPFPRIRRTISI